MENSLEYNSERPKLIIPEYGRHVQKMVDYACSIEDREKRNKVARTIIEVIGNLNPQIRDVPDFTHKLWDHLFLMSDFKLDVDSPYPIPSDESLSAKPEPLAYPQSRLKYRYYGKTLLSMIDYASKMEDGEEKEALTMALANHMKKCYVSWNKDTVEDGVIFEHMKELSKGILVMDPEKSLMTVQAKKSTGSNVKKKRTNKKYKKRN
jgi:hypothetical protein